MDYALKLEIKEPWFSLIFVGAKRIIALSDEKYMGLKNNDLILFVNGELGMKRHCVRKVWRVKKYDSMSLFLKEKMSFALPTILGVDNGLRIYEETLGKTTTIVGVRIKIEAI